MRLLSIVSQEMALIVITAGRCLPKGPRTSRPSSRRYRGRRRRSKPTVQLATANQWYPVVEKAGATVGAVSAAGDLTFTPLVRGGSCCFRLPVSPVAQYLQTFRGIAAAGSWVQNPLPGSSTQWVTGNADGTRNGPVDRTALRHRDFLRRHCRTGRQSCVRMEFNSRIGPRHLFLQQKHGASWLTAMILPSVCLHRFTTLTFRKSSPAVET